MRIGCLAGVRGGFRCGFVIYHNGMGPVSAASLRHVEEHTFEVQEQAGVLFFLVCLHICVCVHNSV